MTARDELRRCLREPISAIADAARFLDAAVSAHIAGKADLASELLVLADTSEVRDWTESLWGKYSPYVQYRAVDHAPPSVAKSERLHARMPTAAEKSTLRDRDGFHCRFCRIPVIRPNVRKRIHRAYPESVPWGTTNSSQHAGFQAMWLQYDHVLPHARGGDNNIGNIVVTCAPCNFARMNYTLEEVGLSDPRHREPVRSNWDGLERFR